jgi:hypothetical protein
VTVDGLPAAPTLLDCAPEIRADSSCAEPMKKEPLYIEGTRPGARSGLTYLNRGRRSRWMP